MSDCPYHHWNPIEEALTLDQRTAYDQLREQHPVAYSDFFHWSLFRHEDVLRTLLEDQIFSNQVSKHVSVPNGMDAPEHTPYRQAIEPYFSPEQVAKFKPQCQAIAADLVESLGNNTDLMQHLATPYAVRIQCAFMGWDSALEPILLDWLNRNNAAIFQQDRTQIKSLAEEFKQLIYKQLELRRHLPQHTDLTTQLMHQEVQGRRFNDEEIASILRNWTVGEVGTIAASIGIIAHFLATNPELQQRLRAQPEQLYYANDEILRLFNPLASNRRRSRCPVSVQGVDIPEEARITIHWISANRDPRVFEDADQFKWGRDTSKNLLYGAGIHLCPGAELARMELIVAIRALLQATHSIELASEQSAQLAQYPMSGFASVPAALSFR